MYQRTLAFVGALFLSVGALAATVDVRGAVAEPKSLEYTEGLRVRQAIEAAGGFAQDADKMAVQVVRANGHKVTVDLAKVGPTPLLTPGDVVEVPQYDASNYVTVVGAVAQPGALKYREGITVGEALKAANPFDEIAPDKVRIVGENGVKSLPSDMSPEDMYAMTLAGGETVHVAYPRQGFSDRQILIIIAIAIILIVLLD